MIERDKFYFRSFCVIFWIMALSNFIFDEFIPGIGESARNPINSVLNIVFPLFGLLTLRKRSDIVLIVTYIILGILSSKVNHIASSIWIADLRRTIPILMVLPVVRYFFTCKKSAEFRRSFDRQLKIFLILQAFALVWQFLKYGANDHGGGTLGNWNSGNISMCIILISFYFTCKNWNSDEYLESMKRNKLYILLLLPVFLNETKVSFLIIALYFILLLPFNIRSIKKIIIAIPVMMIAGVALIGIYMWAIDAKYDLYGESFFDEYLTGGSNAQELIDDAYEAADFIEQLVDKVDEGEWLFLDIPRFMKIAMLPDVLEDSRGGYLLGAGLGHTADFKHPTKFADDHIVALFGTRMMIHYTLLPMGILGLIWAFFWYKNIIAYKTRSRHMAKEFKLFLIAIIVLTFFYNEFFNVKICSLIFYFICFEYTYKLKENQDTLPETIEEDESETVNRSPGL